MWISGLAKHKYMGLCGLDTLIREASLRPVQIVRQFVSNRETQICRISAYHRFEGLSIAPEKSRESRRITNIPGSITNQVSGYARYVDMKVLDTLV
jgi:hypothetical protein